jgi:hypothetical protein
MASQAPPSSVRQSPPPLTDERGMPMGAVISPPDSASSGSDDDGPEIRGRKSHQLRDLRDAVSQISQPRSASPAGGPPSSSSLEALHTNGLIRISLSTPALADMPSSQRRSSHMRSATEPNASAMKSAEQSVSVSEEDTDEDLLKKPQMVRKKSGELVRPALRPSSRRRPSSMPGTPVFSKAVHFDSHLEHVRHFLQVDRPLAVSAGSSPVENYDSDNEYPFDTKSGTRSPPYEWEILTTNFPHDNGARRSMPVRLEKVWLSPDQKTLLGSVAVANLAFQKLVVCRFTLDYWKTTSEVVAEYGHEIRPKETAVGYDRFNFSIKLADTANLESKTLFFCLRYSVGGQEFWDNNSSANFQVDFRKKHLPQNGKNSFRGASSRPLNGLPRSNRRTSSSSGGLRPKSMPATLDDFGDDDGFNFDQPIHEFLGESGTQGLRLKSKSTNNLASDDLVRGLSSPSGAAFANRYDFGASLSAAVQAAKDSAAKDKDALYMKKNVRAPRPTLIMPESSSPIPGTGRPAPLPAAAVSTASIPGTGIPGTRGNNTTAAAPGVAPIPGTSSPSSIASSSYEELVNKYCFVRTPRIGNITGPTTTV